MGRGREVYFVSGVSGLGGIELVLGVDKGVGAAGRRPLKTAKGGFPKIHQDSREVLTRFNGTLVSHDDGVRCGIVDQHIGKVAGVILAC
jgi:hypothetical protein